MPPGIPKVPSSPRRIDIPRDLDVRDFLDWWMENVWPDPRFTELEFDLTMEFAEQFGSVRMYRLDANKVATFLDSLLSSAPPQEMQEHVRVIRIVCSFLAHVRPDLFQQLPPRFHALFAAPDSLVPQEWP